MADTIQALDRALELLIYLNKKGKGGRDYTDAPQIWECIRVRFTVHCQLWKQRDSSKGIQRQRSTGWEVSCLY